MPKCAIIFQPNGQRGEVREGETIRNAASEVGIEIESICGGKMSCGKCKVQVLEGMSNLSPIVDEERRKLKTEEIASNHRLACAARVFGDILVYVPEESRAGRQIIRKGARKIKVKIDPPVKKYYVELRQPTLHNPVGDLERLLIELEKTHGLKNLKIDHTVLKELPSTLRNGNWKVTVSVWKDEIIRVEPGLIENSYGLAVDIGTTTVVGYLTDLRTGEAIAVDSMVNPQIVYGEDVMSRITYAMTHKDGLTRMHSAIIEGLNKIAKNASESAGIKSEDILEVAVVGNTVMHHIFLKINPTYLGLSPFPPAMHKSYDIKARELGLKVNNAANIHVLPIEASFVGADNAGVLIATEPYKQSKIVLTIDIGTNGEIVLGNRKKLLSASCATGPAFEGAHIKFGMRAAPGVIEHLKISPETYEVEFSTIEEKRACGICGSGIIEAVAEMFKAGIIRKDGSFNTVKTPRLRIGEDGKEFVIAKKEETATGRDIAITLSDVRAVQLAKGAIYAGAKILMKHYGTNKLDKVLLAGAFGSCIDKEAAAVIGLYPNCDLKNVVVVGNAAGDGARIALLSNKKREEADEIARQIQYIELTLDPDFQSEFVKAMHFPHAEDEFPSIKQLGQLK